MAPLVERLRTTLSGRYAVEHELGRGGMAVVFLGRDLRLERRVAIKVFEREGASGEGTERFLREIRVAAQLQHPNILPVHESGEAEGLVYYVMPYVAGASLRERLEREGPLPIDEAVRIAREVALALDHAHGAGIVHRDIKPDNVMLSGGVAVVADFGIARALEQGGARLTDTGLAIGTPNYMSPEQATAQPNVDGRADIYALGCVLYEMLAGSPPFSGPTAQAVMARHTADAVPPLRTVREVPEGLERAVVRALAKAPADRWATGRAFAEALAEGATDRPTGGPADRRRMTLARVGLGAAAALVVAAGAWLATARAGGRVAGEADSLRSVAVLPFTVIGDTARAYVAFGLTEAVITALVKVEGLRVPSHASVAAGADGDPLEAGRRLRVATVLTGSVQVEGERLRVSPRLVRVADGVNMWAERYSGELVDIFAMQDSIAQRIVTALQIRLAPAGRAAIARGVRTSDPVAYNLYTLGRFFHAKATGESLRRAVDYFKQAIRRDSAYADALVSLVWAYDLLENIEPGGYRVEGLSADELLSRGIELDSTNGEAHMLLARRAWWACDTAAAIAGYQAATRFSPGSAEVHRNYALLLWELGRSSEALERAEEAARLEPTAPWVLVALAHGYAHVGRFDSAVAVAERALALDTTHWVGRAMLGQELALAGRIAEGIAHLEAAQRLGGAQHGYFTAALGWAYARAGRRADAERVAATLTRRVPRGEATRLHVAFVYAGMNLADSVFAWLARTPSHAERRADEWMWEPMLAGMRSDPRFSSTVGRRACS